MLNISLGNALVVIEIIALYKNRWDSSRIKHRLNTVETYTRNEENAKAFQAWFKNQSNQNIQTTGGRQQGCRGITPTLLHVLNIST